MNADASGIDYTAPMEQHQSWYSLREYYLRTRADLPPPARLLVSEFLRCVPETIWFTYPAHLPHASLHPPDRKTFWQTTNAYDAYIPVEDLNDGWRKNGSVGQELYGAGAAFQIASLTCTPVPEAGVVVYCEYPLLETPRWDASKGKLVLRVGGVGSHSAKLEISPLPGSSGPKGWFAAGSKTPGGTVSPFAPEGNKTLADKKNKGTGQASGSPATAFKWVPVARTAENAVGVSMVRMTIPGDSLVTVGP
jgi:hypothetical protein